MPFHNILLLVADDLGREQLGCYGCTAISTPNLDRLAACGGSRFDMALASTASCSGSRTTIYTGLHTHENGSYGLVGERNGFQTWAHVETAPRLFNAVGYKTGILGKVHVAPESVYPWETRRESETRNTAWIADQAEAFFQEAKAEARGFFLTIGYVDPHRVLASRGKFGNEEGNYDPRLQDRVYTPEQLQVPSFLQDVPAVREELAEYYRAIHRLDQGVGLVLDVLEKQGLSDDTLVLFLSDNGPPFVNSKTTLYDAGIHLPFLLRVPGLTHGQVNPNMVSWTDVLPTLLDWAGHAHLSLPRPSGSVPSPPRRGRSLLPIAHASTIRPDWAQRVFGSHTFHEITNYWPTRMMRTRRYKYHRNVCWKLDFPFAMDLYASLSFEAMRNADPPMVGRRSLKSYICRPPEELYDLDKDPEELRNLAGGGEEEAEEVLKEMRREVEAWQMETKDLWLWKDGVAVQRFKEFNYEREGLLIPDRFDMDLDNLAAKGVACMKLHSS